MLPKNMVLYTIMEPCNKRLSGNKPCVKRIPRLRDSIKAVYIGIKKPEFIAQDVLVTGSKRLQNAGIQVSFVEVIEDRTLEVSLAGDEK